MTIKDIVSIIAEIDQALEAKNLEPTEQESGG